MALFVMLSFLFVTLIQKRGDRTWQATEEQMTAVLQEQLKGLNEAGAEDELIAELTYDGIQIPYDQGSRTFYLPVNIKEPVFEAARLKTDSPDTRLLLSEEALPDDIAAAMAENSAVPAYLLSDTSYMKCNLAFTGLPVMSMTSSGEVTEGELMLFDLSLVEAASGGLKETKALTTGTLRGNTSLTYEKKSLRLKLKQRDGDQIKKKNVSLLGLRKDDDWILNSLYADNTRLRDKLCMDLWQEVGAKSNTLGISMGVKGEYVEVVIDHGYAGLYLLSFPVDAKLLHMDSISQQLRNGIGSQNVERIYKKKYSAPLLSEYFVGDLPDANMPDYRGGYLLKGDTIQQSEEEWAPLHELAGLMEADDAAFSDGVVRLCDASNVMENWLFYQATGAFDNENKNHYFVTRNTTEGLKGYFIPWDMNISFGCVYTENEYYCKESMEALKTEVIFEPGSRMYHLNAGGSAALAKKTWKRWRSDVFRTDAMMNRIDQLQHQLTASGALIREQQRWPMGNAGDDLTFMKSFTKKRLQWLDELLAGG
ncbi:MAG: CotH kinase family protein [Lachnospiraceae bacterium]|nr:CotH kinase family protein [Lachnospiraceae bacterium]